jgi:hypothetical protein
VGRDRIEHGQFRLLNRRDGVVDRPPGVVLRALGIFVGNLRVDLLLLAGDPLFHVVDVGGECRFRGIPFRGTGIANRLDRSFRIVDGR